VIVVFGIVFMRPMDVSFMAVRMIVRVVLFVAMMVTSEESAVAMAVSASRS
jgi:hypothetical protein